MDVTKLDVVNTIVNYLEGYYGIQVKDKNSLATRIYNEAVASLPAIIPRSFNMIYKEETVNGTLGNISLEYLIYARELAQTDKFGIKDWENCLIPLSDQLAYCRESKKIYSNLSRQVIDYLDKIDANGIIYDIVTNMIKLPLTRGQSAEVYDLYIRKEKSISYKKYIIADKEKVEEGLSVDNPLWAFHYIHKKYIDKYIKEHGLTKAAQTIASHSTAETYEKFYNIIKQDFLFRTLYGMSDQEALDLGLEEQEKYGFSSNNSSNVNFLKYIEYLAEK